MTKRRWSARSLRNLEGIHPNLRRVMDRALQECPNDFVVTCGLRTLEEQKRLVDAGASHTMKSAHLTGYAVDVAYYDSQGKIVWDWPVYDRNAVVILGIAKEEGVPLQWGGEWSSLRDGPHFELHRDFYNWNTPFEAIAVKRTEKVAAKAKEKGAPLSITAVLGFANQGLVALADLPEPIQIGLSVGIFGLMAAVVWQMMQKD